ncbi:MAG: tetratricopeptide repeat protein [Tepidisphaeraceae bacterium]|jgi:Tfp pilus assembly protein PilF
MNAIGEAKSKLRRGELDQAVKLCGEILRSMPAHLASLQILEVACKMWVGQGQYDTAAACFELMLVHLPDSADLHLNLAAARIRQGERRRAVEALREAVRLRADWIEAHYYLALTLEELGEFESAASQWRRVLQLKPDHGSALFHLGSALCELGDASGGDACLTQARHAPANSILCNDLGMRSLNKGQVDEAVKELSQATILDPGFAAAWMNLGIAQMRQGMVHESLSSFRTCISLEPGRAEAHWNYSGALLAVGDWIQGWREYEWRIRCPEFREGIRAFDRPVWQGENLRNRTILLHDEQGYGDTIQFMTYAPLLADRGAYIIVLCDKAMERLLRGVAGVKQVLIDNDALPPFDYHISLPSLPHRLATTLETVPRSVPYLKAEARLRRLWSQELPDKKARLRVGLAWCGNAKPNPDRSMHAAFLKPLIAFEGAVFHSLQKAMEGISVRPPEGMKIVDYSAEISDFADTAALIANMDLVITIDTAVAHLAGAMGKPTWLMLPYAADWRWLLKREDSPWYPTMRLFRQDRPGDWEGVILRVRDQLSKLRTREK